mmetsp:Transcript_65531/g.156624  ORF Transcript_65531/g.156624 Transcript_65531/m.156624 type:complete len:393 (+) Transcript_65531:1667-2845(+)
MPDDGWGISMRSMSHHDVANTLSLQVVHQSAGILQRHALLCQVPAIDHGREVRARGAVGNELRATALGPVLVGGGDGRGRPKRALLPVPDLRCCPAVEILDPFLQVAFPVLPWNYSNTPCHVLLVCTYDLVVRELVADDLPMDKESALQKECKLPHLKELPHAAARRNTLLVAANHLLVGHIPFGHVFQMSKLLASKLKVACRAHVTVQQVAQLASFGAAIVDHLVSHFILLHTFILKFSLQVFPICGTISRQSRLPKGAWNLFDALKLGSCKLRSEAHLIDVPVAEDQEHPLWVLLLQRNQGHHDTQGARSLVTCIAAKDKAPVLLQFELQFVSCAGFAAITPGKAQPVANLHKVAEKVPVAFHITNVSDLPMTSTCLWQAPSTTNPHQSP